MSDGFAYRNAFALHFYGRIEALTGGGSEIRGSFQLAWPMIPVLAIPLAFMLAVALAVLALDRSFEQLLFGLYPLSILAAWYLPGFWASSAEAGLSTFLAAAVDARPSP